MVKHYLDKIKKMWKDNAEKWLFTHEEKGLIHRKGRLIILLTARESTVNNFIEAVNWLEYQNVKRKREWDSGRKWHWKVTAKEKRKR